MATVSILLKFQPAQEYAGSKKVRYCYKCMFFLSNYIFLIKKTNCTAVQSKFYGYKTKRFNETNTQNS